MPVRKILRSYRTVTGIRPNKQSGEVTEFESMLERDYLLMLSFSTVVKHYEVQPVTINYLVNDKSYTYTPDVLVTFYPDAKNSETSIDLIEIKYTKDLIANQAKLAPKFAAARKYCEERGWGFHIITEKEIRCDYLQNIKFLLRYYDFPIDDSVQSRLLHTLRELRESSPKELLIATCHCDSEKAVALSQIWKLISNRVIEMDLSSKLGMNSPIWLPELHGG